MINTIRIALLLVAYECAASQPDAPHIPVQPGYQSMTAYGLMHFILDDNHELLGVFTSEEEVRKTINIETIMAEFVPINVIRYGRTGSLSTDVLERLAQSERREQQSHGKDSFWQDLLVKRREEEALAQDMVNRLNTIK
jgi:hypothetical protein